MKDADYVLVDLTNAAIGAQSLLANSGGAYLALKKADKARRALNAPISASLTCRSVALTSELQLPAVTLCPPD